MYYLLNEDKTTTPVNMLTWVENQDPNNKIVKQDYVTFMGKEFQVSTVFLGIDHGYDGIPLLFETMIFHKGTFTDLFCERYHTYDQALSKHEHIVKVMNEGCLEFKECLNLR